MVSQEAQDLLDLRDHKVLLDPVDLLDLVERLGHVVILASVDRLDLLDLMVGHHFCHCLACLSFLLFILTTKI